MTDNPPRDGDAERLDRLRRNYTIMDSAADRAYWGEGTREFLLRLLAARDAEIAALKHDIERARAEEREACAKVADNMYHPANRVTPAIAMAMSIASRIRARTEAKL